VKETERRFSNGVRRKGIGQLSSRQLLGKKKSGPGREDSLRRTGTNPKRQQKIEKEREGAGEKKEKRKPGKSGLRRLLGGGNRKNRSRGNETIPRTVF